MQLTQRLAPSPEPGELLHLAARRAHYCLLLHHTRPRPTQTHSRRVVPLEWSLKRRLPLGGATGWPARRDATRRDALNRPAGRSSRSGCLFCAAFSSRASIQICQWPPPPPPPASRLPAGSPDYEAQRGTRRVARPAAARQAKPHSLRTAAPPPLPLGLFGEYCRMSSAETLSVCVCVCVELTN